MHIPELLLSKFRVSAHATSKQEDITSLIYLLELVEKYLSSKTDQHGSPRLLTTDDSTPIVGHHPRSKSTDFIYSRGEPLEHIGQTIFPFLPHIYMLIFVIESRKVRHYIICMIFFPHKEFKIAANIK